MKKQTILSAIDSLAQFVQNGRKITDPKYSTTIKSSCLYNAQTDTSHEVMFACSKKEAAVARIARFLTGHKVLVTNANIGVLDGNKGFKVVRAPDYSIGIAWVRTKSPSVYLFHVCWESFWGSTGGGPFEAKSAAAPAAFSELKNIERVTLKTLVQWHHTEDDLVKRFFAEEVAKYFNPTQKERYKREVFTFRLAGQ